MARKKSSIKKSMALPVGVAVIGAAGLGFLWMMNRPDGSQVVAKGKTPPNGATSVVAPVRSNTPLPTPPMVSRKEDAELEPAPVPDRILWNRQRAERLVMELPARKAATLRRLGPLFAGTTGDMAEASNRLTDAYRVMRRDLLAQLYNPADADFKRLMKGLEESEERWTLILTDSYEREGRGTGGTMRINVAGGSLNAILDQQIVELVSHMGFVDDDHDFVSWKQHWDAADTQH